MTSSFLKASSSYLLEYPGFLFKRGEFSFYSHAYNGSTIFDSQIYVFFFSFLLLLSISYLYLLSGIPPLVHISLDCTQFDFCRCHPERDFISKRSSGTMYQTALVSPSGISVIRFLRCL